MATITPVINEVRGFQSLDGYQVTWGPMQLGDIGASVGSTIYNTAAGTSTPAPGGGMMSGFVDKTFQVVGTFGASPGVNCEGSNDAGANWLELNDAFGNPVGVTAPAIKEITEAPIWVRPHVVGGDGSTLVTVTMFFRKTQTP